VLEAPDASAALSLVTTRPDISLVFSDVVMPGKMSGYELYDAVRVTRPNLPVLLTTGYPRGLNPQQKHGEPGLTVLQKPYETKVMLQCIAARLARRPIIMSTPRHEGWRQASRDHS
jgi:CheY-like chemotaxis protein